mmetsp:Transcript_9783/g.28715  ORF Transcript_9783/g.28715 Transcript_9783/m.28715 type:complete len:230 (+) Transcript_9783:815-1504(+)
MWVSRKARPAVACARGFGVVAPSRGDSTFGAPCAQNQLKSDGLNLRGVRPRLRLRLRLEVLPFKGQKPVLVHGNANERRTQKPKGCNDPQHRVRRRGDVGDGGVGGDRRDVVVRGLRRRVRVHDALEVLSVGHNAGVDVLAGAEELRRQALVGAILGQLRDPAAAETLQVVPLAVLFQLHLEVPEKPPRNLERFDKRPLLGLGLLVEHHLRLDEVLEEASTGWGQVRKR